MTRAIIRAPTILRQALRKLDRWESKPVHPVNRDFNIFAGLGFVTAYNKSQNKEL